MASPPYGGGGALSPPAASPLALPRQRPSLALPGIKSRKTSTASAASSAHPLRQTSFPPADSLEAQHLLAEDQALAQYSPSAEGSLDDFSDDNEIRSAISGPAGDEPFTRKRKRPGEKRPRGRPSKFPRASSTVNGDDARSQNRRGGTSGAPSVITADDADAEAEDDEEDEEGAVGTGGGRVPLYEGGQMTPAEMAEERHRRNAFYESLSNGQKARMDSWQRGKLRVADVRKLVNQTLGQSVPQNVVLAVSAYAKMFAGMLIEEARGVQGEWTAVEERAKKLGGNKALERLRKSQMQVEEDTDRHANGGTNGEANGETNGIIKNEPTSPNDSQPVVNGVHSQPSKASLDTDNIPPIHPGGAGGLEKDVEECDRGPLLPDHLREALRRYKNRRAGAGGPVGFTGLGLEGRENAAPRIGGGGRRLFR